MQRDLFLHVGEDLTIQANLTYSNSAPIAIASHVVEFATALELTTNTLQTLSSSNTSQINVVHANNATVQVFFRPLANAGYTDQNHVYQLRSRHTSSNVVTIHLEGRIFFTPSLFD